MTSEQDSANNTSSNGGTLDVSDSGGKDSKNLKYPKQVFFIISNEFCERFCFYGNRTILAIYLQSMLGYSEDNATIIYHTFVMLCYFFPIIGAIIADCYLGKYRTILYLSMLYALGNITLALASNFSFNINHTLFSLLGLFLIAVGTGGIKPCVSSFGGDQFFLPEQEVLLASFFSVFYFSINAGSLISTYLTPELRVMSCLGHNSCYPLAFGIPAVLMVISLVVFVCGRSQYLIKKPEGNILVDVSKCVGRGVCKKIISKEKKEHWLDHAADKHSPQLVRDTKILMELIYLFTPTILFWALYDQQGSRWTFQATHMNGKFYGYTIQPDQMQAINPILILALIPIFEFAIYPILAKFKLIRTSLEKLFWGGMIGAVAFAMSAYVEYNVQGAYAVLPKAGEAQLRIYNSYTCPLHINASYKGEQYSWNVSSMGLLEELSLPVSGQDNLTYSAGLVGSNCHSLVQIQSRNLTIFEKQAVSYITTEGKNSSVPDLKIVRLDDNFDDLTKSDDDLAKIRLVYRVNSLKSFSLASKSGSTRTGILHPDNYASDIFMMEPSGDYQLTISGTTVMTKLTLGLEGVYSLLIAENVDTMSNLFIITPPNSIHMLWQLPQIIVISIAEIMFSITGLEFSYSKAPASMKSVISSLWLLTDSFGNLLIIVLSEFLENIAQVYVLGIFAILMALVMVIFIFLAKRYLKAMKTLVFE